MLGFDDSDEGNGSVGNYDDSGDGDKYEELDDGDECDDVEQAF